MNVDLLPTPFQIRQTELKGKVCEEYQSMRSTHSESNNRIIIYLSQKYGKAAVTIRKYLHESGINTNSRL